MLILFNLFWINIRYFNFESTVNFIDLPKGEATLIMDKMDRCNILIDTGEDGYSDLIYYLKLKGIKRLDALIITHSDSDHIGLLDEITDEFFVKRVYISKYESIPIGCKNKNIDVVKLKASDTLQFKNIVIKVISPKQNFNDTNNNSLVFVMKAFGVSYLFTGDIESLAEQKLEKIGHVDVLKVAHHGSNTSTTDSFLDKVDFQYAICMNGYKNSYSFPNSKIVLKLGSKLYVTSECGSITIKKKHIFNRISVIS